MVLSAQRANLSSILNLWDLLQKNLMNSLTLRKILMNSAGWNPEDYHNTTAMTVCHNQSLLWSNVILDFLPFFSFLSNKRSSNVSNFIFNFWSSSIFSNIYTFKIAIPIYTMMRETKLNAGEILKHQFSLFIIRHNSQHLISRFFTKNHPFIQSEKNIPNQVLIFNSAFLYIKFGILHPTNVPYKCPSGTLYC